MACSVSKDTLQYRLEESVSHRRTRQVTQMLTYLLTHKLFSYCIRRYLVSRTCDWVMPALSAVLLTFSFKFSLLFFHVGSQAAAAAYVVYPISHIGRCRKYGKYVPCTRPANLWIDSNGKNGNWHLVGGSFGSEVPAISNRCVVMTAWSRKAWKFCEQLLRF